MEARLGASFKATAAVPGGFTRGVETTMLFSYSCKRSLMPVGEEEQLVPASSALDLSAVTDSLAATRVAARAMTPALAAPEPSAQAVIRV